MLNLPPYNRILLVTGHYGSGKTEFAVSLAMRLAREAAQAKLALIDLDIVNPYFRSRERREELEAVGVSVYGGMYGAGAAAEIPELAANVRAPLEDKSVRVILDAGGNDSGAMVLNQFRKYFTPEQTTAAAVVNFSRFETRDVAAAAAQIARIERMTGLAVEYIVNNTHLLRETTPETLARGHEKAAALCELLGKKLFCDTFPSPVVPASEVYGLGEVVFPVGLYMRETWHDR
ncbi:MAG: ATP-binding protein [Oscillospiraceae bacterium]|jgi:energy-coupling factor transporter ATP-binding protein EcfA2|nr:ATP-binding protein [Oscillospiraceae bacterium]